ncbi:hypothetical protein [Flavobacterium sp. 245]|uniref:hypothetical protein n=1 Tax=Flavobacterium sp. 245 TaxID=2512115 RepID=UPI00105CFF87|nr:hypothetical protein [Flavobacterium sp. 245]TDO99096.1 hypothetical protein EV145_1073 [Flavobacterium sp. 245]
MKKLFTLCVLILALKLTAQTKSSGDYSVTISNVTTAQSSGEMFGVSYSRLNYKGNYIIYKKGAKIASQEFSALKGKNVTTVNISFDDSSGNTVTYDHETKLYEFMGEEKNLGNSKKTEDVILNSILYYAELMFK